MTETRSSKYAPFLAVLAFAFASGFLGTTAVKLAGVPTELPAQAPSSAWEMVWCDLKGWFGYDCEEPQIEYALVSETTGTGGRMPENDAVGVDLTNLTSSSTSESHRGASSVTYVTNEYVTRPVEREIIKEVVVRDGTVDTSNFITRSEYDRQIEALLDSIEASDDGDGDEGGGGSGTVSSVDISVPSFLSVTGGPITTSGTLSLSLAPGYSVPLTASTTKWDTAYSWGDHSLAGYVTNNGSATLTNATATDLYVSNSIRTALSDGCVEVAGGVLTSTGSNCGTVSGGITSLNGQTNSSQSFATSTSGGLSFAITSGGGVHTFTAGLQGGYVIPLSASTTEWTAFYNTPSSRIGTASNLSWSGNTLGVAGGYSIPLTASTTEWSTARNIVNASSTFWDTAYSWGDHSLAGYLTFVSTSTVRGMFSTGSGLSYSTTTGQFINTGVLSIGGQTGAVATSSLHVATSTYALNLLGFDQNDYLLAPNNLSDLASTSVARANLGLGSVALLNAIDISDHTNLSVTATGLTLTNDTIGLTAGFTIPLTASTTEWSTAYASTTALTPSYIRGLFSDSSPITYNSGTGAIGFDFSTDNTWTDINTFNATTTLATTTATRFTVSGQTTLANASTTNSTVSGNAYFAGSGIWNSSGLVGIGTTTPTAKLHVLGTAGSSDILAVSSSTGTRLLTVTANGNVGIGTSNPQTPLDVYGDIRLGVAVGDNADIYARDDLTGTSYRNLRFYGNDIVFNNAISDGDNVAVVRAIIKHTTGNVGISTSTPSSKLTVAGDFFLTGALRDTTNSPGTLGMVLQSTGTSTRWVATSSLGVGGLSSADIDTCAEFAAIMTGETGTCGSVVFSTAPTLTTLTVSSGGAAITGTTTVAGHVLPGTNDTYDLGSTTARFRDLYLGGETIHLGTSLTDEATFGYNTSTNILNIDTDGTTNGDIAFFTDNLYLDKSAGNVGIGDTSPDYLLELSGATAPKFALSDTEIAHGMTTIAETDSYFMVDEVTNDDGGARLWGFSDTASLRPMSIIGAFGSADPIDTTPGIWLLAGKRSGTGLADLGSSETVLQVAGALSGNDYLTVLGSGNVGIGTTTPAATLDIIGNSTAGSGSTYVTKISGIQSVANTGGYNGLLIDTDFSAASGNTLTSMYGADMQLANTNTGTVLLMNAISASPQNISGGTVFNMSGVITQPQNTGSGLVGDMRALNAFPVNNGIGTTTTMYGVIGQPVASAGGVTNMYGYYTDCKASGASAVVTNCYGLRIASPTLTGTITNVYGVYQDHANAINYFGGNVGIGDTTPTEGKLTVGGTLYVLTNTAVGSDPLCWDGSGGSLYGDCSSLAKWKTNVEAYEAGLDEILALETVTFDWKRNADGTLTDGNNPTVLDADTGFIADQVASVNYNFGRYDAETGALRDVNDRAITGGLVNAIKELNLKIEDLATSTLFADLTEDSFTKRFFNSLIAWFADTKNGIAKLFAKEGHFSDKLCVGDVCVTEAEFSAVFVNNANQANVVNGTNSGSNQNGSSEGNTQSNINATSTASTTTPIIISTSTIATTTATTTDENPPTVTLNGNTPITLTVGNTYNEEGAIADDDVDGPLTVEISGAVNINQAGTYTITYTATDSAGNVGTIERIVIAEELPPADPPLIQTGTTTPVDV